MYNALAMLVGLLLVLGAFGGAYRTSFLVDKVAGRKMLRFVRWIYTLVVGYSLVVRDRICPVRHL
jgi:hypothetical protein